MARDADIAATVSIRYIRVVMTLWSRHVRDEVTSRGELRDDMGSCHCMSEPAIRYSTLMQWCAKNTNRNGEVEW